MMHLFLDTKFLLGRTQGLARFGDLGKLSKSPQVGLHPCI